MEIFDVSAPIFVGMPVYKNKPEKQPEFTITSDHGPTTHVRESRISLDAHTGTHVDAPLHMIAGGSTIDSIALDRLIRPCRVIDLSHVSGGIERRHLQVEQPKTDEFLLLKTRNSADDEFSPDFVFLAEDGAQYLASVGIAGVGIDGLGIERSQPEHPTHKILFDQGILIIEGLRLRGIDPGAYWMLAAPLKLVGLDAAPARIALIRP